MFEYRFPNMPADAARALGEYHIKIGKEFLRRARHAERMAVHRDCVRDRRAAARRIWLTVGGLQLDGLNLDEAWAQAARLLSLDVAAVREAWRHADGARGAHKRRLRNLEIARRAARGETSDAIANAVRLHPRSVSRIIRGLAKAQAFDRPVRRSRGHPWDIWPAGLPVAPAAE